MYANGHVFIDKLKSIIVDHDSLGTIQLLGLATTRAIIHLL